MSLARWLAKKSARRAVGLTAFTRRPPHRRVRVLTYHRFGTIERDAFCIRPEVFEAHVALLARQRRAVSLDDVIAFSQGKADLPDDACLITMDDGYVSFLEHALPILARYGVPGLAFITAGMLDKAKVDSWPEPFLTRAQLRELRQGGMTIGSHGYYHRSKGRLPVDVARRGIERAKGILEDTLGEAVTSFAYPFGTHGDFNAKTDELVYGAGHRIAFHSQHAPIHPGMLRDQPRRSLPRIKIEAGDSIADFERFSRGGLDVWGLVDANLWRFQRDRDEQPIDEPE